MRKLYILVKYNNIIEMVTWDNSIKQNQEYLKKYNKQIKKEKENGNK